MGCAAGQKPAPQCCTQQSAAPPSVFDKLHTAAEEGRLVDVQSIIEEEHEAMFWRDDCGYTVLHVASACGKLDVVRWLCKVGGHDLLFCTDDDNRTALHTAAYSGWTPVVKFLLDMGGNDLLFMTDCEGGTALHVAAQNAQEPTVKMLATAGGKSLLSMEDVKGCTAMDLATQQGEKHVARMLEAEAAAEPSENSLPLRPYPPQAMIASSAKGFVLPSDIAGRPVGLTDDFQLEHQALMETMRAQMAAGKHDGGMKRARADKQRQPREGGCFSGCCRGICGGGKRRQAAQVDSGKHWPPVQVDDL